MVGKEVRIRPLWGSKNMNVSDRANGENGNHSSPGPFSWYLAEKALPELKYALTVTGYVVLP
jgi:hypothetical protein